MKQFPGRKALQRGFTLIEIMVVVIIIGILIGLVAPDIVGFLGDAERTTTRAQMHNIETALDTYRMNHARYPSTDQGLEALLNPPNRPSGYMKKLPQDAWGNDFQYRSPGVKGGDYDLYSLGADGAEGGEGSNADIGNWE